MFRTQNAHAVLNCNKKGVTYNCIFISGIKIEKIAS